MEEIKIGIAEDHPLYAEALKKLLKANKHFSIQFVILKNSLLLDEIKINPIDILILDVVMPDLSADFVIKSITKSFPHIKILIHSSIEVESELANLIQLGIYGFVPKSANPDKILDALFTIHKNTYFFSENVIHFLINKHFKKIEVQQKNKVNIDLSELEMMIIRYTCMALSAKQIGLKLNMETRRIESCRTNLIKKLDCKNLQGLVAFAFKNNITE